MPELGDETGPEAETPAGPAAAPAEGVVEAVELVADPELLAAVPLARQALAIGRDNPEVLRLAGFALAGLAGENETALAALDGAIELNPNYAFAYAQRGIVLTYLNRPDEAIAAAERAIRLSPNDPSVFNFYLSLGLAHLAAGRYEGFWELTLAPWDIAAGILLIREAGGIVTDLAGAPARVEHTGIITGNPAMHAWLEEAVRSGA